MYINWVNFSVVAVVVVVVVILYFLINEMDERWDEKPFICYKSYSATNI